MHEGEVAPLSTADAGAMFVEGEGVALTRNCFLETEPFVSCSNGGEAILEPCGSDESTPSDGQP